MNESIKKYFRTCVNRRPFTVEEMKMFKDKKIIPTVTGDLSCTTSEGELQKLSPCELTYFDVLNLRRFQFVSLVKTSLAKGYVKESVGVKVDFYKGTYGKGFICDFHNKESKNYVERKYYCFNNAVIPADGFILVFNNSYDGEYGKDTLKSVFKRMQNEKIRYMEFQKIRYMEFEIAKDILQIYNVNAF